MLRRALVGSLAMAAVFSARSSLADTFAPGSVIIPMDTTYQDSGMLRAFGLVYELLRNDVPVQWVIRPDKAHLGVDFTASAVDHVTRAAISAHGYRGGPWVIDSADAARALPIINAWQKANPAVVVHEASASFWGDVARYLVVAPTIAMHQDGNEKIARSYLQAAGIPDSTLDPTWPATSPDMLTPAEVAGPTTTNHHDGMLFDADGDPVYCQFMSMHWGVTEAAASPETVMEVREYLKHPVHFFAECQAVNAFEGAPPTGGRGNFLTTQGFQWTAPAQPKTVEFYNDSSPFAQIDGAFQTVGGSEAAYSLASGSAYHVGGVGMITKAGTPEGDSDVWMTGFLDGACPPNAESCDNNYGKVSYLGGHQYSTALPISKNPQTQGTRLFLNSLFEAPCATRSGQPEALLWKTAPESTTNATVTFTLDYSNTGVGIATSVVVSDQLPPGATFVSASSGYQLNGTAVSWSLGSLGSYEEGRVSFTVTLSGHGTYANTAHLKYKVGLNAFSADSNTTSTIYDADSDGDGVVDSADVCPNDFNTTQILHDDRLNCDVCGNVCTVTNGTARCANGTCAIGSCQSGFSDCDGNYASGCEHADAGGTCCDCVPANATGACIAGACTLTSCSAGYADCDANATTGCEYVTADFASDPNHCGGCGTKCSFANATALCSAGSCVLGACVEGFTNIDAIETNGCECAKVAAADITCNGVDDDCNGLIDDGYVPTSCGVGSCAAKSRCVTGNVLPCSAGPASSEGPVGDTTCADGADNDCNGTMDDADPACASTGGSGGTGSAATAGASSTSAGADSGGTSGFALGGTTSASGTTNVLVAGGQENGIGGTASSFGGTVATTLGGASAIHSGGAVGNASGGSGVLVSGGTGAGSTGNGSSGLAVRSGGAAATLVAGSASREPATSNDSGSDDGGCSCRVDKSSRSSVSSALLLAFALSFGRARRRRVKS